MGIGGVKYLSIFLGLSTLLAFEDRQITRADCAFHIDPDRFLASEGRVRREVNDRAVKLNRLLSAREETPARAAQPESIPQRNFVDQEIFGKLIRTKTPSAQLSTDAEFVRRIYLDLTGRIPSSDDVRAAGVSVRISWPKIS